MTLPNEVLGQEKSPNHVYAGMILIPGGTYQMGGSGGDAIHVQRFWLDRTEVTVRAYLSCVDTRRCSAPERYDAFCNAADAEHKGDHPVNCVTWRQANAYCTWRNKRLPSEQEWEFAARGSDERIYPWGNAKPKRENDPRVCAGRFQNGTCPAGSTADDRSPFGVLDMAGNVKEWTATFAEEPGGVFEGYVIRGGGWEDDGLSRELPVHTTEREILLPSDSRIDIGFRCAASP